MFKSIFIATLMLVTVSYSLSATATATATATAKVRFVKLSSTGKKLPVSATQWNCVNDKTTKLTWEVKTDAGDLHDKGWTYSWYEPDTNKNGGDAGTQNGGVCGMTSDCDTHAYVAAVNSAGWCGKKDWRLPTANELNTLVDYSRLSPAINTDYFPLTGIWFWSSSPYAGNSYDAWFVSFDSGSDSHSGKNNRYAVRLVRGGQ